MSEPENTKAHRMACALEDILAELGARRITVGGHDEAREALRRYWHPEKYSPPEMTEIDQRLLTRDARIEQVSRRVKTLEKAWETLLSVLSARQKVDGTRD